MDQVEVKNIKIDELKAYEHNPRNIGQNAIDAVAHSIQDFGFQQPIVVDQDKVIIVGHTRLLAAKQLGLKEVPVVVASDLSKAKADAFRLADNKTGELADWDFQELEKELDALTADFEMEDYGFESSDFGDDADLDDYTEPESDEVMVECPSCHAVIPKADLKKVSD